MFFLNKNIVHLIDNIFWNMGFKTETRAEKVRIDLGLVEHVWQDKRPDISQTVEALGDQFRQALRAGWLPYIQNAYAVGAASSRSSAGQGPLVVGEDE
mmetsp:Transcript_35176/g.73671  ORF Transcript_35176/g.73671 Transcript_35176/m.73671 type:complete len:98 (+) Transcript_35176:305-598(+)|eukprot:CAMPEP_0172159332 /NCGR_PEP_ID=MMETSP1050-20130122/4901_1 /TAXON_ID=233186 /ORGANISM="Cryptomonas curvata, Strain CCAP979/52" /LENGTH=97 /DNA_ID=CAMNT_0012828887 /DNA_START=278 /DNA_END=571 /DNA_ORIENTATION=+